MKDRKEPYTETKIEISLFYLSDIITTSGPQIEDGTVDSDGWAQVLPMKFVMHKANFISSPIGHFKNTKYSFQDLQGKAFH